MKIIKILHIDYHSSLSLVKTYISTVTEICAFVYMSAKKTEILKSAINEKSDFLVRTQLFKKPRLFCLIKYYFNIAFLKTDENIVILY